MLDQPIVGLRLHHLDRVIVERAETHPDAVWLHARVRAQTAACPTCQTESRSVHVRYHRRFRDAPISGRPVWIVLQVRRFTCRNTDCTKRTFAEQVPDLTMPRSRRSVAVRHMLHGIGAALAGRAGARLAANLSIKVSRHTLLRLLRAAPAVEVGTAPQALGVDDFALRKGQTYATILLDMETRQPIDVLPDREAGTLAAWLTAHPGAEIICRDRAGAYAEGARTGAPDAIQVADRWHLWHNLGEAVETVVVAHRASLPEPAPLSADQPTPATPPTEPQTPPSPDLLRPEQPLQDKEIRLVTRTQERHAAVQALLAEGCTRAEIGRRLGLDPQTVRRFADASTVDELLANTRRETLIDTYAPYLRQRWDDGCTDATTLVDEIRDQGFRGSIQTVRRYLQPFRGSTSTGGTRPKRSTTPAPPTPPKPRRVATWIMTDPVNLRADDQARLTAICQRCPALQALANHVRDFAAMMRNLTGGDLPQWMAKVLADDLPGLHSFVKGVQRDLAAVTAGLTLPWSSGAVEGQVNRVKMLKRQMYGRANFDLLRLRILQPN